MSKPTTRDITANIVASIQSKLGQTIPFAQKAFVRVLAKATAGVVVTGYTYADWIALQASPSTASFDETEILGQTIRPLVDLGRRVGAGDPQPASAAVIDIAIFKDGAPDGTVIPAGTTMISPANGVTYATNEDKALLSGSTGVRVLATAVSDPAGTFGLGTIGNLGDMPTGSEIPLVNPIAGFQPFALFILPAVPGEDAESESSYRQRVLDRTRRPPQGGSPADYRAWAVDVPGVADAWPYRNASPGAVDLYIKSTEGDGVADLALLLAVDEYLNDAARKPVSATVNVLPVSVRTFDVEVQGLSVPDYASAQSQIEAALATYFAEREPQVTPLSVPPQRDRVSDTSVAGVVETVATAAGGFFEQAKVFSDGETVGFYTLNPGELATLGDVTYV